jgi:hypothetical protein
VSEDRGQKSDHRAGTPGGRNQRPKARHQTLFLSSVICPLTSDTEGIRRRRTVKSLVLPRPAIP